MREAGALALAAGLALGCVIGIGLADAQTACIGVTGAGVTDPGAMNKVRTERIAGTDFAAAREALQDAMLGQGLNAPTVSHFGRMLTRTAGDLGHPQDLYDEAEIFTFCSAAVAARVVASAREHIAWCPLSIALYSLPDRPGEVVIAYRPPPTSTPGGRLAAELMDRITKDTRNALGGR